MATRFRFPGIRWSVWYVRQWWQTRDRRLLFAGLPALAALVLTVVVAGIAMTKTSEVEVQSRYFRTGHAHLAAGRYDQALVCFERLVHLAPHRQDVLFALALASEGVGQTERAVQIMSELAPQDKAGYAPAHLWYAKQLLQAPQKSPKVLDAAEAHLLRALDGELDNRPEAEGLLGELYLARNRLDQAELYLLRAVKADPRLHLRLAYLYARKGDRDRARWEGEQAASFYRAWTKSEVHTPQARLGWADAAIFLENFDVAVSVLEEGLRLTGDPVYREALAKTYMAWADALARRNQSPADATQLVSEQLRLLEKALQVDPHNHDLVMQVWAMTQIRGEVADKAREVLRSQLVEGKGSGLTHLALGMDAWQRGKQEEALLHLEQAYKLAPHLGIVANNLAWVLANMQPPDLDRALQLVNTVLEQWPNQPMCRDTRGYILFRMGRYREALADYQAALPALRHDPGIHQRLADVYAKLGMTELSEQHAAQARKLLDAASSSSR
ncbi:MAG: tetratricopeptide repeat protein [Gemmatales bacterium]|nr:tetratricopeptide repeat protein [Gemmatales bacterium]MDW8386923.1 tetratricopeptide repeat protein [Gemmatales bacterium]